MHCDNDYQQTVATSADACRLGVRHVVLFVYIFVYIRIYTVDIPVSLTHFSFAHPTQV